MKKVILTSATLLAFAAASYAQTNQQGSQQYAEQIRNGANQTGTINQLQGTNVNYGNYAITIQGQQSNTGPNVANINQNDGSQGNRAGITQNGGPNQTATINQNGGSEGLSGGGVSSSATIGMTAGDGNFGGIAQMGTNNTATLNQNNNSRRNRGEIYQNGSTLTATVNQNNGAINNGALVLQGYTGQNAAGTAITNATATINQGRVAQGDNNSSGSVVAESVSSTATILQNASFTTAFIAQGTSDVFGIIVGGGVNGRADGSQATIDQRVGSTNSTAAIEQGALQGESFGSRATLIQSAANNTGLIGQGGALLAAGFNLLALGGSDQGSVANITQNGTGNSTTSNQAFVYQGVAGGTTLENVANVNQASTTQNGFAAVIQGGGAGSFSSNDEARITQAGKATSAPVVGGQLGARIYQNVVDGTVAGGSSTGRLNLAIIDQQANVTDGFAFIDQGHSSNGGVITSSRNVGTITQVSGTGLRATIQQGTDTFRDSQGNPIANPTDLTGASIAVGTISTNNTGTINQLAGNNHSAQLIQNGRFNTGLITQSGAGTNTNTASIIQAEGANRGYAEILQNAGANNVARILQLSGSDTDNSGVGNYARIVQQTGSNNLAELQQGIAFASGRVSSSNDNFFSLIQNGSNNTVRFIQQGNNNSATIVQNGNNNAVGAQGGAPGSIAQQVGYGNRVVLTQNGTSSSNLYFGVTQIGNNLTAIQTQNGN